MLDQPEDIPTIRHAIRKRIEGLNPTGAAAHERISVLGVFVKQLLAQTRIILLADIDGVPHKFPAGSPGAHYWARRDLAHADLLNLIDRMADDVTTAARAQRRAVGLTGEIPMSQAELDARIAAAARLDALSLVR